MQYFHPTIILTKRIWKRMSLSTYKIITQAPPYSLTLLNSSHKKQSSISLLPPPEKVSVMGCAQKKGKKHRLLVPDLCQNKTPERHWEGQGQWKLKRQRFVFVCMWMFTGSEETWIQMPVVMTWLCMTQHRGEI